MPYCTSDSWSGTKASSGDEMFSFMGSEIVTQVVRDLVRLGLNNANSLLLAGSSAGGTGVMLNLDRVENLVNNELGNSIIHIFYGPIYFFFTISYLFIDVAFPALKNVAVRGVSDSGWFMDREPYSPSGIAPMDAVRKGIDFWKGRVPESCAAENAPVPWRCYFGYRLYPTLTGKSFRFH